MDRAAYEALGISTAFEDKLGGRNPSGSGFVNINDDTPLDAAAAAVREGPSEAEYAEEQRLYPPPPEASVVEGTPTGTVTELLRWSESTVYPDTERDIWIYVPHQHDTGAAASLLVVNDGKSYLNPEGLVRTTVILDNLIAAGSIPPTVAVFLEPGRRRHPPPDDPSVGADGAGDIVDDAQRSLEYDTVSETYGRFLLEDILPVVRSLAPNITCAPPCSSLACPLSQLKVTHPPSLYMSCDVQRGAFAACGDGHLLRRDWCVQHGVLRARGLRQRHQPLRIL